MEKIYELIEKALKLCELGDKYENEDNGEKSKLIFEQLKSCIKEFDELNCSEGKVLRLKMMKGMKKMEGIYKKRRS